MMEKVVCFGASLTAGTVSANYLELLAARPALAGYRFSNHGVNADLAWNGLQRLGAVVAEEPSAITILIGTNDVNATMSERNRLRYLSFNHLPVTPTLAWYEENLRAIVSRLRRETAARLALISLAVLGEDLAHEANRKIAVYNQVIRELASETGAAYLPLHETMLAYLGAHAGDYETEGRPPPLPYRDGLVNTGNALARHAAGATWNEVSRHYGLLLTTDGIHLNETAAALLADLIEVWLLGGIAPIV